MPRRKQAAMFQAAGMSLNLPTAFTAFAVASEATPGPAANLGFGPTFGGGVIFQVENPKAWPMGITAMPLFLSQAWLERTLATLVVTFIFPGLPANVAWAGRGGTRRTLLSDERRRRIFNQAMAILLLLSTLPVWMTYR